MGTGSAHGCLCGTLREKLPCLLWALWVQARAGSALGGLEVPPLWGTGGTFKTSLQHNGLNLMNKPGNKMQTSWNPGLWARGHVSWMEDLFKVNASLPPITAQENITRIGYRSKSWEALMFCTLFSCVSVCVCSCMFVCMYVHMCVHVCLCACAMCWRWLCVVYVCVCYVCSVYVYVCCVCSVRVHVCFCECVLCLCNVCVPAHVYDRVVWAGHIYVLIYVIIYIWREVCFSEHSKWFVPLSVWVSA